MSVEQLDKEFITELAIELATEIADYHNHYTSDMERVRVDSDEMRYNHRQD